MDNKVQANTLIDVEKDLELRRIAAELRISRSELVRIAINEIIKKYHIKEIDRLPGPENARRPLLITVEEKE